MRTFTSLLRVFLHGIAAVAIVSCGGGDEEPVHPPSISSLTYSPATALQSPGSTVTINGAVEFADAGGDIVSFRMTSSGGADLTVPTPQLSGVRSGTGSAAFVVSVDKVGKYTFEIWMVDSQGSASNRLPGTFEVLPTDAWTKLGVTPPNTLHGIGWNGRQYVAVGSFGTVMTSPDLNSWTVQTAGVSHDLRSVASSPARIVAVGDNGSEAIIIGSTDGATWAVQHRAGVCQGGSPCATPAMLSKVIWAGGQFVAVGQEHTGTEATPYALILTSPDGVTWTQRAPQLIKLAPPLFPGAPVRRMMTSVAWSGSALVAVGIDADENPAAWYSTNAATWTPVSLPQAAVWLSPLSDITWGNGRFVAVSPVSDSRGHAPVLWSSDGINWQSDSAAVSLPPMNAVTAGASEYLAVSNSNRQTSPDSLTWRVFPMSDCGNGVLWDGTRYVSVGAAICRSP